VKTIKFAKRWRWPLTATSYEAYSAGDEVTVSNDRAEAAQKAGVLDGEPVDAPEPAASDAGATKKPKA
jgi:hypothetical protein